MNWLVLLFLLIGAFLLISEYIRRNEIWKDRVAFYGPILALKSARVGFFDFFQRYTSFFRVYGSIGVVAVVAISLLISLLLILSVRFTLIFQPEPTGIYEPQNILLLPGINEFVPSTFAVWFAFLLTIGIHELGHGILCRIERIRVRSVGALIAVIPIGFFVEPDEEELENLRGWPRLRMFGAGITNNLVIGFACFAIMILLAGMLAPTAAPVIHGVYQGYPADIAGIPQNSFILGVNGTAVASREDVTALLNRTAPGDTVDLLLLSGTAESSYAVTLAAWPEELGNHTSGFMGIYYFDAATGKQVIEGLGSPLGLLRMISIPFDTSLEGKYLRVLAFDSAETGYFTAPFPLFWEIVHLLFWSAWININVGMFNAIPMIPLDGGYIMQEGITRTFERRGIGHLAKYVVAAISWLMLVMLIALIALPYLLHL
ncbi:MAG: PDZ domain-containing protein [Methanomicrobiales archaeon]|nr:PDZ domain-containing protein [Methanomicrobiales archaeon]